MPYDIIVSRIFFAVPSCECVTCVTITVTYDVTFCLLFLCLNKEKEIQNKIKKLKRKEK